MSNSPIAVLFLLVALGGTARAQPDSFASTVKPYLDTHCFDCHDAETKKGDIVLDDLTPDFSDPDNAELWEKVMGQIQFDFMPPAKKARPDATESAQVAAWILDQMDEAGLAEAYRRKLLLPQYGNYVSHEQLFSGEIKTPAFTPVRVWRRSPYIFSGSVRGVGKAKTQNPYTFSTPKTGIRDYAVSAFVGASVVETIVLNANAEIEMQFDQLTGGAERDAAAAARRKEANAEAKRSVLEEAERIRREAAGEKVPPAAKNPATKDSSSQNPPTPKKNSKPRRIHEFEPFLQGTDGSEISDEQIERPLSSAFNRFTSRQPTEQELKKYVDLLKQNLADTNDPRESLKGALIAVYLAPEAIYRMEWGLGEEDEHGRRMLSPDELAFALSFALFDSGPYSGNGKDATSSGFIGAALREGKLETKEDVRRVVTQIMDAPIFEPARYEGPVPRLLRFFHEFFGYDRCGEVFKDAHEANLHNVYVDAGAMVSEADALLRVILRDDKKVFERLLSTNELVVKHNGATATPEKLAVLKTQREEQLKRLEDSIANFDLEREEQKIIDGKMKKPLYAKNPELMAKVIAGAKQGALDRLAATKKEYAALQKAPLTVVKPPSSKRAHAVTIYNMTLKDWRPDQPLLAPENQRAGILTHPAWLVAHSFNAENDPVHRGKWVFEKLLAGAMPDLPPDVDAQVPEDHTKTLRERMELLRVDECWRCHRKMNPLGEAFEIYNHYGRWIDADYFDADGKLHTQLRTMHEEENDGKTRSYFRFIDHDKMVAEGKLRRQPVNAKGSFKDVGIPGLEGEFSDATEMCRILAKHPRVRQSIIRHMFRYFMGRNELLSDSQTLIDADQAYVESDGSFRAVVVSLLSSDSFLYRK